MNESSKDIYTEGEYLENNPTWHEEDSSWKVDNIVKILQHNNLQPQSICEVGCGAGEILNLLYQVLPAQTTFSGFEIIFCKFSGTIISVSICSLTISANLAGCAVETIIRSSALLYSRAKAVAVCGQIT